MCEIRIDTTLNHANGQEVALKPGAPVEVTVAADPEDAVKKQRQLRKLSSSEPDSARGLLFERHYLQLACQPEERPTPKGRSAPL